MAEQKRHEESLESLPSEKVRELLKHYDTNNDGLISWSDFTAICKQHSIDEGLIQQYWVKFGGDPKHREQLSIDDVTRHSPARCPVHSLCFRESVSVLFMFSRSVCIRAHSLLSHFFFTEKGSSRQPRGSIAAETPHEAVQHRLGRRTCSSVMILLSFCLLFLDRFRCRNVTKWQCHKS